MLIMKAFSPIWFIEMAVAMLFLVFITKAFRNKTMEEKTKFLKTLSVVAMVVFVVYKADAILGPYYETNIWHEFPLQLCNLSIFLAYPALTKRFSFLKPFAAYDLMLAALAGLVMPNNLHSNIVFWHPICLGFYATHLLGLVITLAFFTMGIYRPKLKDILSSTLILMVLVFLVHLINMLFRATGLNPEANYCFTYGLEENAVLALFWKIIPVPYLYLYLSLPIILALNFITFGITKLVARLKKPSAA